MKLTINAPWTNGDQEMTTGISMFEVCLAQLKFFRRTNKSIHLKRDINGYEELIKTKSDETADNFLKAKDQARLASKPFKDNLEVIKHLKKNNLWRVEK